MFSRVIIPDEKLNVKLQLVRKANYRRETVNGGINKRKMMIEMERIREEERQFLLDNVGKLTRAQALTKIAMEEDIMILR
jgi:hypothetical protein